jgi:hypothetical protein
MGKGIVGMAHPIFQACAINSTAWNIRVVQSCQPGTWYVVWSKIAVIEPALLLSLDSDKRNQDQQQDPPSKKEVGGPHWINAV